MKSLITILLSGLAFSAYCQQGTTTKKVVFTDAAPQSVNNTNVTTATPRIVFTNPEPQTVKVKSNKPNATVTERTVFTSASPQTQPLKK